MFKITKLTPNWYALLSRPAPTDGETVKPNVRVTRPLYDIPYMYEAREFLRKKLIGKKVNVEVDYIQPPNQGFPEKTCCTVTIGGMYVFVEDFVCMHFNGFPSKRCI